jgi:phage baseplate assembly protein W|tara:strand:- start:194 stop:562 length:369 start_codon:yes stop_codon:yes gene_type:complete
MASFGVALPLSLDTADGFVMLKDIRNLAKQNLKMLILTLPGERVMKPKFGVGLSRYLFENFGHDTMAQIESKIREQVSIYMPAIQIRSITFGNTDPDNNYLGIAIEYSIDSIGIADLLEITT